ncbi:MAG: hypothetical protein KDK89_07695 [Alphaproteobacteria bacterium]|nr:hypothetical protein [Alphaproteobacteria bacterium]
MTYDVLHWIGRIYDCAAEPAQWGETLTGIRDEIEAACVVVALADSSEFDANGLLFTTRFNSPWDEDWLMRVQRYFPVMPGTDHLMSGGIDASWHQMTEMDESVFHKTTFYLEWAKPQGLRDCINVPHTRRDKMVGLCSAPCRATREIYSAEDCRFLEALSPHIRRALVINDIVDKGRLAQRLYREVLDRLSSAVFLVGPSRRIIYANEAGERLLGDEEFLRSRNRALEAVTPLQNLHLADAIDRAVAGDAELGIKGIGVPLLARNGARAAVYVLSSLGRDARAELGHGHAIVFLAHRAEQQPMTIEILRTVFELTNMEARIACQIVNGHSPVAISEAMGLSVNTVRSHLSRAFAKTGSTDQVSLAACINRIIPPIG